MKRVIFTKNEHANLWSKQQYQLCCCQPDCGLLWDRWRAVQNPGICLGFWVLTSVSQLIHCVCFTSKLLCDAEWFRQTKDFCPNFDISCLDALHVCYLYKGVQSCMEYIVLAAWRQPQTASCWMISAGIAPCVHSLLSATPCNGAALATHAWFFCTCQTSLLLLPPFCACFFSSWIRCVNWMQSDAQVRTSCLPV